MFCARGIILFGLVSKRRGIFFLFHLLIVLKTPNAFRFFFFFSFQFTLRKLENNSSMFTKKNVVGPTEIWTRIAGFRVQSANHYTMGPFAWQITENGRAFFLKRHHYDTSAPPRRALGHAMQSFQRPSYQKKLLDIKYIFLVFSTSIKQRPKFEK